MRKLVVSEFMTLDGVIQGPSSPDEDREGGFAEGGWQPPYFGEDDAQSMAEGIAATDAYLFGRKTYEIFARHWPNQPDSDMFAKTLNSTPKHIVSNTLSEPLAWRNSKLVGGDFVAEIGALKEREGKNITVLGSGALVQALAKNDLVDEYRLMICPIVLGQGKRLFGDGFDISRLELIDSQTNAHGVLTLTYRSARGS